MSLFKQVRSAKALIRTKAGLYKELDIYKYNNELYAMSGSGFYRLYGNFCTSSDSVKWIGISGVEYKQGNKGSLNYIRLKK